MIPANDLKYLDNNYFFKTKNPLFAKTLEFCRKASKCNANILLSGESGTGKEVLAKYIHCTGNRKSGNFVAINCTAYSETLLESELFGHEQGSFTGATATKQGKIEIAQNGTLFLDEVGDISVQSQTKLLRVIETKAFERIGSNVNMEIDFHLVSATNVNIKQAIVDDKFREDFFYRISTIVINVPPLREHREDLPYLIQMFLQKASDENNIPIKRIEKKVLDFLYSYDYPGNVRELKNIIDRMVVFSQDGVITDDGLPIMFSYYKNKSDQPEEKDIYQEIIPLHEFKQKTERDYLNWVLDQTEGNVAKAARRLSISTRHLFNKINQLGLKR